MCVCVCVYTDYIYAYIIGMYIGIYIINEWNFMKMTKLVFDKMKILFILKLRCEWLKFSYILIVQLLAWGAQRYYQNPTNHSSSNWNDTFSVKIIPSARNLFVLFHGAL